MTEIERILNYAMALPNIATRYVIMKTSAVILLKEIYIIIIIIQSSFYLKLPLALYVFFACTEALKMT